MPRLLAQARNDESNEPFIRMYDSMVQVHATHYYLTSTVFPLEAPGGGGGGGGVGLGIKPFP